MKIAIVDMGQGGILCADKVMELFENANASIICDCFIVKTKSSEMQIVYKEACDIIRFIDKMGLYDIIVVGCNSLSVYLEMYGLPKAKSDIVLISKYVKDVLYKLSNSHASLVIGSQLTVSSSFYNVAPNVISLACPWLAYSIEKDNKKHLEKELETLFRTVKQMANRDVTIVLACTHYPALASRFEEEKRLNYYWDYPVYDPATDLAKDLFGKNTKTQGYASSFSLKIVLHECLHEEFVLSSLIVHSLESVTILDTLSNENFNPEYIYY